MTWMIPSSPMLTVRGRDRSAFFVSLNTALAYAESLAQESHQDVVTVGVPEMAGDWLPGYVVPPESEPPRDLGWLGPEGFKP